MFLDLFLCNVEPWGRKSNCVENEQPAVNDRVSTMSKMVQEDQLVDWVYLTFRTMRTHSAKYDSRYLDYKLGVASVQPFH